MRTPIPARRRSAGRSRATSAAARATRTSSSRCSGQPSRCGRRRLLHRNRHPRKHRRARRPEEVSMAVEEKQAASWLGQSIKRKEDDRFLQGRGNYVDDVHLPGMLHMAILRSPLAHARIKSIETSQAAQAPGVVAVVTGETLAAHNLAWMPTLSGDTQAVLATDKVRMQGQEVACVVAETPYQADDALALIEVDYDPLPVVTSPQQALEEGAPLIRDDK